MNDTKNTASELYHAYNTLKTKHPYLIDIRFFGIIFIPLNEIFPYSPAHKWQMKDSGDIYLPLKTGITKFYVANSKTS